MGGEGEETSLGGAKGNEGGRGEGGALRQIENETLMLAGVERGRGGCEDFGLFSRGGEKTLGIHQRLVASEKNPYLFLLNLVNLGSPAGKVLKGRKRGRRGG